MSVVAPFTEAAVTELIETWFHKLDVHAPSDELLPLLVDDGLEMRFPEATLHGHQDFLKWYDTVAHRFFDEIHELKEVNVTPAATTAEVKLVVNWQARTWDPPAAKSQWLGFDAAQTWVVTPSADTGQLAILVYTVDGMTPMPGSASL